MVKKIILVLDGIQKGGWYVTNEEQERLALHAIDDIMHEMGISYCVLGSTEDFPSLNAVLAEHFDDEMNLYNYVEVLGDYEIMGEVGEMIGEHHFTDEAITACLKSLGWI